MTKLFQRSLSLSLIVLFANASMHYVCGQTVTDERLPSVAAGTIVDFNPDNGRSDIRTKLAHNWAVTTGKSSQSTIDSLEAKVTTTKGEGELTWGWWKAGYDHGATISSDGVVPQQTGDGLELSISGLAPGKHSLTTWHNHWELNDTPNAIQVTLQLADKSPIVKEMVTPSRQVKHDDHAASAHFEFEVAPGQMILLKCSPTKNGQSVVLNGFAIDVPDPARTIRVPNPAHGDEHTTENPVLTWQPPRACEEQSRIRSYQIYQGTNASEVAQANSRSTAYRGSTTDCRWQTDITDFLHDQYWRVDCEFEDGTTTTGKVNRYRVRHDAFPSAEGYGRFAIGGRGGRVIQVTNLDDSGPGSLRDAVEAEGPRTIVFRVGGTIQLKSKLLIRNPYVTIAGQTAPGDGVCVRGYTFGCFGTHDVIMRYMRLRVGDESGSTMDGTGFASTDHSIFDHCSVSWSIDEAVSSRSAKNITLQRCIVAEALNIANHKKYKEGSGHSFAGSISGDIGSFHHNLLVHCAGRNWSLAGGLTRGGEFAGRLDIRNNVVYNWQHRTNDGGVKALNLINNLYIPGPATKVFHLLKPDIGSLQDRQQYYVRGNRMEGHFTETGDNWSDAVKVDQQSIDAIRLIEPFCDPLTKTHPVAELLNEVTSDVGANHAGLDAVDQRVIADTLHRTVTSKGSKTGLPGIIDSQSDVGGWPELRSAEPPLDSDKDGLPNDWELAHHLNPNQADQNQPLDSGGITAMEVYLAELARPKKK